MYKHSSSTTAPLLFCPCGICKAARHQGYSIHMPTEAPLQHCFCDICMAARFAGYFPMIKKESPMNTKTTTNSTALTALKTALYFVGVGVVAAMVAAWIGLTLAFAWVDLKDIQGIMTTNDLMYAIVPNMFLALFTVLGGTIIGAIFLGLVVGIVGTAGIVTCVAGSLWESFKDWWFQLSDLRQARYSAVAALFSLIVCVSAIVNGREFVAFVSAALAFGLVIYVAANLYTMIDPSDLDK